EAADFIWRMRRTYHGRQRTKQRPGRARARHVDESPVFGHHEALGLFFAAHVESDPEDRYGVAAFRRAVLPDGLVPGSALRKGTPPQPARKGRPAKPTRIRHGPWPLLLPFPNEGWATHIAIRPRGVLDRLRHIAAALAEAYGWQPAEAVGLVLSG